jgi:hypothetical protein
MRESIGLVALAAVVAVLLGTTCERAWAAPGLTTGQANRHVLNHLADLGYGPNESYCRPRDPYSQSGQRRHKVFRCPFLAFLSQAERREDDTEPDCSGEYRLTWTKRRPHFRLRALNYLGCSYGVAH